MSVEIIPNFATAEECRDIISAFNRLGPARATRKVEHRIEISGIALAGSRLHAVRERIIERRGEHPDWTLVTAMSEGDSHDLHADAEKLEGDEWVPNHTHWHTGVALVYLNSYARDYTGGILCLPQLNLELAPKQGMLVSFPAGRLYTHEVSKVLTGVRYTIAVWMTETPERYEQWPIRARELAHA